MRLALAWLLFAPSLVVAQLPVREEKQAMETRDSVIIRVTSPRSGQKTFSGVITLRDAMTERRLDNMATPFEIRLPAQDIDAQVTGTMNSGAVRLYFEPGKSFGFGRRLDKRSTLF